jgi:hypothetical protein
LEEEMKSTKAPDWRDVSTLHDISAFQAMQVLAQIGVAFSPSQTIDTHDERLDSMDASAEAAAFADACNSLGTRLRARNDCRPGLRVRSEEKKREEMDPALEFAENCRAFHRR